MRVTPDEARVIAGRNAITGGQVYDPNIERLCATVIEQAATIAELWAALKAAVGDNAEAALKAIALETK